jgi:hypothetical protein
MHEQLDILRQAVAELEKLSKGQQMYEGGQDRLIDDLPKVVASSLSAIATWAESIEERLRSLEPTGSE